MPRYNPDIHKRRSIRLKSYDYSLAGLYFITICCHDKICRFGHVTRGEMILNEFGQVAYNEWIMLKERYPIELDVFQVMPNHFHGIVNTVGATLAVARNQMVTANLAVAPKLAGDGDADHRIVHHDDRARVNRAPTVGDIVGAYKSLVVYGCRKIYQSKNEIMGKFWQRNYWEHIIRNDISYQNISEYIINNPIKWAEDKYSAG